MNQTVTKDNLFKPVQATPASRAEITDRAARAIIAEEARQREAKTQRLRQARLEMEARQHKPAADKPKAKGRKSRAH